MGLYHGDLLQTYGLAFSTWRVVSCRLIADLFLAFSTCGCIIQTYCRLTVWRSQHGVVLCRLIADLLFDVLNMGLYHAELLFGVLNMLLYHVDLLFGVLNMGLYHEDLLQTYCLAFSTWGCIMQTYCRFIVWRSQHGVVSCRLIVDLLFGVLNMGLYHGDLLFGVLK